MLIKASDGKQFRNNSPPPQCIASENFLKDFCQEENKSSENIYLHLGVVFRQACNDSLRALHYLVFSKIKNISERLKLLLNYQLLKTSQSIQARHFCLSEHIDANTQQKSKHDIGIGWSLNIFLELFQQSMFLKFFSIVFLSVGERNIGPNYLVLFSKELIH